jgi:hypothetical protein|tara:strand:+ start:53 stop:340 length:288 start_codon:yes stop_codon:yes gene_type:complete
MSNETDNSNETDSSNEATLTTVKTVYARAAIILLALNFAFTGYLTHNMNKMTAETLDSLQNTSTPQASVKLQKERASHPSSPLTVDETIPQTLDK